MEKELGKYFIKNGEIYMCIAYTDRPTTEFKNIRTGKIENCVVGSAVHEEFKKLCAIENKYGKYDLDGKVEEIENIVIDEKE